MGEIEHLVVNLCRLRFGMYDKPTFFLKVTVCPDVVVAGEEMYLHSHVGKL